MQKVCITIVAFLCLVLASTAQSQGNPKNVNVRFSDQLSNGQPGNCGCFHLEGGAGDLYWSVIHFKGAHKTDLGLVGDVGVEHVGNVNGAGYGLTMTTVAGGPRFVLQPDKKFEPFAQVLFGFAHGSGSAFPKGNTLVPSASSFEVDAGAGADYKISKKVAVRILQLDYLRTALPNNVNNWQNNLRLGFGFTFSF